jgi:hypothetical protein
MLPAELTLCYACSWKRGTWISVNTLLLLDGEGWDGKDELTTDEELKANKIEKIRIGALPWAPLQLPHSPVVGDATPPTRAILSGGVPPEYSACSLCEKTSTNFAVVIAGRTHQFHSRCWKIYRGG